MHDDAEYKEKLRDGTIPHYRMKKKVLVHLSCNFIIMYKVSSRG